MQPSKPSAKGRLFVISAPSGAGKTSLTRALLEQMPNVVMSVSHTTRPRREGEQEGINYYFVDEASFHEKVAKGDFLEHAKVFDNYYGTSKSSIEQVLDQGDDLLLEIDWQGAVQVFDLIPEAIGVFILPPSKDILRQRLTNRALDDASVVERRLDEASFEMSKAGQFHYVVVNDDFDRAMSELKSVILSHRLATARQLVNLGDQYQALIGND